MATWTIQYWGGQGLCNKMVAADSKQSALDIAKIPTSRILKVTHCHFLSLSHLISAVSYRPSAKVQMLFFARSLALFAGGGANLINQVITSLPELKRSDKKRSSGFA